VWAIASRHGASQGLLRFLDAAGVILFTSTCSLGAYLDVGSGFLIPSIVGASNAIVARAVIVPSPALRTLWIGLLASVPPVIANALSLSRTPAAASAGPVIQETALVGLWCLVAVVTATVASRIIFGLRREVKEARRLGQYTLEERIGAGGMGEVYKARHALLRRPTAIKLVRSTQVGEQNIARFEREVQSTSRLTHPNTIAIYDYGRTPDGTFYYAMEYLPGITLDELVKREGAQPAGRLIHILKQICASLAEAHDLGLIHRDIKGANVILCERGGMFDVVKVVDFGLVKNVQSLTDNGLSGVNTIAGTPLYLSPEILRQSDRIDGRSDLYSLGVLAFYLLTGKQLFQGKSFMEIASHHLQTPPPVPSTCVPFAIPRDLETVILRCLEKDPALRPANARALSAELAACANSGDWEPEEAHKWWREYQAAKGVLPRNGADGEAGIPTTAFEVTAVERAPQIAK
jgi:serine/threonine-protein kinase